MLTHSSVRRKARLALVARARPRRPVKPAKYDGDGDGFRTGPSGKDDVPYTPAAKRLAAKAAKRPTPAKAPQADPAAVARYRQRLRDMDDAGLEASLQILDSGTIRFANPADQQAARRAVVAEIRRRDRAAAKDRQIKARYEALLGEGRDELTAWALATGQDPDRLARKMERLERPSLRQMRRDWELIVETEFLEAEQATRGQMVKPEGRSRIDPRDFWRRPASFVARWASEEFQRWASQRGGVTTFAAYRAMVEGRNVRDVRTREGRRLGEFR